MRDHLVAEDFKNPSELALHADKLWDAHRVQPGDPLLAAAAFSRFSPSRARGRSMSPVRCSQTTGPTISGDRYFHKRFGSVANNCRPPCSFQENSRADGRRRN